MRFEQSIEVAAPPARVFDVLADPSTHPHWRPSATEFRLVGEGALAEGSELVETVRFLGRSYTTRYEVTELQPPHAFAVRSVEGPLPLELRCTLGARPAGTCVRFELDLRSRNPLLGPVMAWYLRDEARRLKRLVESRNPSSP